MVGDPSAPKKRGFDKFGYVHCIVWGMIYKKGKFFAAPNEHTLAIRGGGIGRVKTVVEGRKRLHAYIQVDLKSRRKCVQDNLRRIDEALEQLGDDPANLERFYVKDDRKRRPSDR
jgi:hypothetical protein